jgi:hypothetical protein
VDEQRLTESRGPRWTRADDYVTAMARKRTARRNRAAAGSGEPDTPRSPFGPWPFLILIVLLGVLGVAIMILAFPGSQPQHQPTPPGKQELGVANRGWFQEAQRDFHR